MINDKRGLDVKHVVVAIVGAVLLVAFDSYAQAPKVQEASAPQGVTVSIYDTGTVMVNEARRVSLVQGENDIVIRSLPTRINPASASYGAAARTAPFDMLEQFLQYDLSDSGALMRRMTGQPVVIQDKDSNREGILLSGPLSQDDQLDNKYLPVRARDGRQLWMIDLDDLSSVTFPFGRDSLATEPQLTWRVRSRQEGPQNFRLSYQADGMEWRTMYEVLLAPEALQADFSARVEIDNQTGGRYENARVRLLLTEKGMAAPIVSDGDSASITKPGLRYAYGAKEPGFERSIAALSPIEIYELPRTVTIESERPTYVQLAQSSDLPIKKFYVYDGVRFDRFQRNRRTDWNYGTEFHTAVQTHVEFDNKQNYGLGISLPPGVVRLYQVRADGAVDLIGEEQLMAIPTDAKGHIRVGPARGLTGERERTGYVEVKPHHVYEESFEIRLANTSEETAEIRVVEHLYRWPEFEIVRSDADYVQTDSQTIEFKTELKPGGRRSIHYTVRYTW